MNYLMLNCLFAGLNDLRRCPKGKHCNFLHVFRNPDGSFNWPEKDYEEESKLVINIINKPLSFFNDLIERKRGPEVLKREEGTVVQ